MGVHPSSSIQCTFSPAEWQEIPLCPFTAIQDPSYGSNFKVLANKLNPNLQLEKYDLFFNGYEEFIAYRDITEWRNSSRHMVQAKYISEPQQQRMCSAFGQSSVYIERIPIRLVQIQDISIQEGLCILYSAVQGFSRLYQKYGFFEIEPDMVGFNSEGFVKVWLNKNLSRHYPDGLFLENKFRTYELFIETALKMIEQLIDFEGRPTVSQFITKYSINKPHHSLLAILEKYARESQLLVPRYLASIRNICQGHRKKKSTQKHRFPSRQNTQRTQMPKTNTRQPIVHFGIPDFCKRPSHAPLEQLSFNKKSRSQLGIACTEREVSTSRTPAVRFHYRNSTLPSSPKGLWPQGGQQGRRTTSVVVSPQRMDSESCLHNFSQKKRSVSRLEKWEIDPEIAADLAKLESNQQ